MISLIEWVCQVFVLLFDKWMSFIQPVCNPNWVISSIVVWGFIFLFLMLRQDYKRYGEKAFEVEGTEFVIAAFAGGIMVGCLYFLPVLIAAALLTFLLFCTLSVFRILVIISVKGVHNG